MGRTIVKNSTVVLPDRLVQGHAVVWKDSRIETVCATEALSEEAGDSVIDAKGMYLAPGFIDLHVHGSLNIRIDAGMNGLTELCRLMPRYGLTGFLPTLCPKPKGEDANFLAALAQVESQGSEILGFHLEGPFLTLTGAMAPEALGTADPQRVEALRNAGRPYPVIFSVAPDFEGILKLIPLMAEDDVPIFMTHTVATVAQTQASIEAGVRHATHFYDVFPYPGEKESGVRGCGAVEAVLADPRVSVDFILDGVHVDPVAVQMALRCKDSDKVCLITDANLLAGMPPGRYRYDDRELVSSYQGGPAKLTENSLYPGGLAGSGLTMDLAVRNALELLGVDLPMAVRMASTNPARVMGLSDRKGEIKPGYDADLVLLDEALEVRQTWVAGRCVFRAEKDAPGKTIRSKPPVTS